MQCLWILEEEAESFIRQNNHALALKRYHQIFKVSLESEKRSEAAKEGGEADLESLSIRPSTTLRRTSMTFTATAFARVL